LTNELATVSSEVVSSTNIGTKLAQWGAKFGGLSHGTKNLIITAVAVGSTSVALKYLFPQWFGSWFTAGFAALMTIQNVKGLADIGVSEAGINMYKAELASYRSVQANEGKILAIANDLGGSDTEIIINNIQEIANLEEINDASVIFKYANGAIKANKGNPINPINPVDRLIRIGSATSKVTTKVGSTEIKEIAHLLYGDMDKGKIHIDGRHINGAIISYDEGVPAYTSFFPTGKTISTYPSSIVLPSSITDEQVFDLIFEGVRTTEPANNVILYYPAEYGIDEMKIIISNSGEVITAYPTKGINVRAWDPSVNDWITPE